MIYIGNLHKGHEDTLRKGLVIRCDRGHSVLCNPFKVDSEDKRDWSCEQFQAYFDKKVREKTDTAFMNELRRIYHLALQQDIVLACWCYPKRCHTQTIKAYLDKYLSKAKSICTVFQMSNGSYRERTIENAQAADITLAFAVDFNTAGERCTKNAAQGKYIDIALPTDLSRLDKTSFAKAVDKATYTIMPVLKSISANTIKRGLIINIAGNGIYMLAKYGITMQALCNFIYFVIYNIKQAFPIKQIRSGGQTGADEAGILVGQKLNIPTLVFAPNGWRFRNINNKDIADERLFKQRFYPQRLTQQRTAQYKPRAKRKEYSRELTPYEKKTLQFCINKHKWTEQMRQAMAASMIREFATVLYTHITSQRQFVNDVEDYCLERTFEQDGKVISGADKFTSLKYKALCLIEQVKYIVLDTKTSHVSIGTVALSQYNIYPSDGIIRTPKIYIAWRKPLPKPKAKTPTEAERRALAEQRCQLKQAYEEQLPETLRERNMHLYRDTREDHSWLEGIQTARAAREEQERHSQLLEQLKDKYKK